MPVYCYRCTKCGEVTEKYRQISSRNRASSCGSCDGECLRDMSAESVVSTQQGYYSEILSDAMGVGPDQVSSHRREFPDVPMTDDGRVIVQNHHEHKRIMKRLGFVDRSGYN